MNATPRPWFIFEEGCNRQVVRGGNPNKPITITLFEEWMKEENRAFILRAVNSYDAMREALEAIQHFSWTLPFAYRKAEAWKSVDAALLEALH